LAGWDPHLGETFLRLPISMRRFVVHHEEEGLVLFSVVEPLRGKIGDNIGGVAFVSFFAVGSIKDWPAICALAGENLPVIETGGIAAEMPFADHGGLIAGGFEAFGDVVAIAIEGIENGNSVLVAVLAGEDGGAAGSADGVDGVTAVEADAFFGDAIDIWCFVDLAAVSADGVGGVVVGHDEEDVRMFGGEGEGAGEEKCEGG
jgi:hypothetical protein